MAPYPTPRFANHLSLGGQPLRKSQFSRLLHSELAEMEDAEYDFDPEPLGGSDADTAFDPSLLHAACPVSETALAIYKHHMASGNPLPSSDVFYLDLSGLASVSDFVYLGSGRWRHRSVPDQVVHTVVACAGRHILGIHPFGNVEDARAALLFFLSSVHGLPESLSWPEFTAMREFGLLPSAVGASDVWSVPIETVENR